MSGQENVTSAVPTISEADAPGLARHAAVGVVAALAFAGLTASFVQTLVTPIQAQLPDLLNAPRSDTAWVFTVTLLAAGITTPVAGRLGDIYGRRRITEILLILLVLGSVIAALSPSLPLLLVGRALQGAVMGVIPLGISLLSQWLPAKRVAPGIALMSATMGIGGAVGLPASAAIAQLLDWHVLFWASTGVACVSLLLVHLLVPADTTRANERFDVIGAVALGIGLAGLLLVVSRGGDWGWLAFPTLTSAAVSLVSLSAWAVWERWATAPLIDLGMVFSRAVFLTNVASFAMAFSLFAGNVAFPQILTLPAASPAGLGMSLIHASLIVLPSGLVMMLLSPFAGRFIDLVGARALLGAGGGFLALAYSWSFVASSDPWHLLVANILVGIGVGVGFAAMPTLILAVVPPRQAGAANGVNALARSIGSSTAAAVAGAVLAISSAGTANPDVPSPAGFDAVFVIGIAAGVVCLLVALIPHHSVRSMREDR